MYSTNGARSSPLTADEVEEREVLAELAEADAAGVRADGLVEVGREEEDAMFSLSPPTRAVSIWTTSRAHRPGGAA